MGVKYDEEKPRMDLVLREVPNALSGLATALGYGAEKYGIGNWLEVEDGKNRYAAALLRHLTAHYAGESYDAESGISHLACVMVNASFLYELEVRDGKQKRLPTR